MLNDILERLHIDPGHRTLGQLLQDREAAIHEIRRLRCELNTLNKIPKKASALDNGAPGQGFKDTQLQPFRSGSLIRAGDICKILGISRATLHRLRLLSNFPKPVLLGPNTKRWKVDEVRTWEYERRD